MYNNTLKHKQDARTSNFKNTFVLKRREELEKSHKSAMWEGAHTEFSAWHYQACYLYLSLCGEQ